MNRQFKKLTVLLVGAMLVVNLFAGCGKENSPVGGAQPAAKATDAQKQPEAEAKIVQTAPLKIYTSVVGGKDPEEDKLFAKEVERLSGVQVELIKPPSTEYNQKLATALASGETIDLMYMNTGTYEQLFPQGFFEPLTERIKKSKILSDTSVIDPNEWKRITRTDGHIYGVFNKDEGGTLPSVRWDWLQKLKLKEPGTLDEYYEVMKAFTNNDPDGNGKKDTYGLTLAGLYDIQPFMGTAGLINKHVQDKDGKWSIPFATDKAVPVYEWLAKLYKEGILDPNFATNNTGKCRELIFTDKAAIMVYWAAWVGMFNEQAKTQNPNPAFEIRGLEPPKGPNGEAILMAGEDGLWIMHKNSKNKDAAFKFLEFWHTEKGNILGTLGIEGNDYTASGGKYTITDTGSKHAMDHGAPYPKNLKWKNPVQEAKNFAQSNAIVRKYAKPQISREDTNDAMKVVDTYGFKIILGEISAKDGVSQMQKELKGKKYID